MSSSSNTNSPSPPSTPQSYCDLPLSPLHSLSCGHIIFSPLLSTSSPSTSTSLPLAYPKPPCGPTCTPSIFLLKPQLPLSWLKNTVPEPFICPQCVEECVRADYDILLERSGQVCTMSGGASGSGAISKETNVRLWTYAAMVDMVRDGGRECRGTAGLFCAEEESVFGESTRQQSVQEPDVTDAWCTRESGEVESEDAGPQEVDAHCFQVTLLDGQGGHGQAQDVDDLADMLQDARVGLESGDVGMDELMAGVEGLMT